MLATASSSPGLASQLAVIARPCVWGWLCMSSSCGDAWRLRAISEAMIRGRPKRCTCHCAERVARLLGADQAAMAGGVNEGQYLGDQWIGAEPVARLGQALLEETFVAEQEAEGGVQLADLLLVEAAPLQADHVQPGQMRTIADDAAEWDHVGFDTRHAADHCRAADAYELMDCRRAADHRMIADADMPTHHRVVGDDDMVAQLAIMRDMRHRHDQAVGTNARGANAGRGAAMDGTVLADLRPRADLATRRLAVVFQVLRFQPNGAEGKQHH